MNYFNENKSIEAHSMTHAACNFRSIKNVSRLPVGGSIEEKPALPFHQWYVKLMPNISTEYFAIV